MNNKKKNALILIDVQYDFCNPNGALFVPGSVEDCQRTAKFILDNVDGIDYMVSTLDSHIDNDIAHPSFWMDKDGNHPAPFTVIFAKDVVDGKWVSKCCAPKTAIDYVKALETEGKFVHVIWPPHCLIGSPGAAIDETIFQAIRKYTKTGKNCQFVSKGANPLTEHFGAFQAQVPLAYDPSTGVNMNLLKTLAEYQNVYLAGQAKSHCVATTLSQALEFKPELAQKIIVLEDCMSSVPGGPDPSNASLTFDKLAQPIYDKAKAAGVRFTTSAQVKLSPAQVVA